VFGKSLTLGGCWWAADDQAHDFAFQGKNTNYATNSLKNYNQEYPFVGQTNTNRITYWNWTMAYATHSSWNRALGNAKTSTTILQKNQANNEKVSTKLASSTSTSLLGLQGVNNTTSLDTNTNRPQLTVAWRRTNDNFGMDNNDYSFVLENGAAGGPARTGHF
jgi:hypothetical protein